MKAPGFGQFLVEQGLITKEAHEKALSIQKKNRLLGEIGVEKNLLREDEIPTVLEYQKTHPGILFGEAAVSLGLINSSQLKYLLDIRTRRKIRIGDILLESGAIEEEELNRALMSFAQLRTKLQKVLVAEPSPTAFKIIESMFRKYGYQTFHATNGKDALRMCKGTDPDILITSGLLQDMKGYELCARIVANPVAANIQMILLSSDDSPENIEKAFEAGVNHFLKKPITERELINIIYQIEREVSAKRSETILVVDDSSGARAIIKKELVGAGFQVYLAENGKKALKAAKRLKPDVITMDLDMPEMGGLEASRFLKEDPETIDIPIIIVSTITSPEIREEGFKAGASEYFFKPFKTGRLADYIRMLLEARKIRKDETILVVEDSPTTQHILRYFFTKNGYQVHVASNGDDALKLLRETVPDLIVTDCQMPVKDGFEFTRDLKGMEEFRHIPVVMLTAQRNRESVLKGLTAGANDFITKPFDEAELFARVETHLLNKKLFDQVVEERDKSERMYNQQQETLREISIISRMGERLQACKRLDDTYDIVARTLSELFPAYAGCMAIYREAQRAYELATKWGSKVGSAGPEAIPEKCTASSLRRGMVCENRDTSGVCSVLSSKGGRVICLPLAEQDKPTGLIQLISGGQDVESSECVMAKSRRRLLDTAAEHIALSIANLKLQENLRNQSIRDPLTNLFNRRYLEESLEREIERARRKTTQLGLIMIDVDHFKAFNDDYGHLTGDQLLQELGALLADNVRISDIVCRYGGEEFTIILPEIQKKFMDTRAEEIRREVEQSLRLESDQQVRTVTISLGIATFPDNGKTAAKLIDAADAALYRAKRNGRNQVVSAASQAT